MEIKIEKNIPIPVTEIKYPFDKMDVGDSFWRSAINLNKT